MPKKTFIHSSLFLFFGFWGAVSLFWFSFSLKTRNISVPCLSSFDLR